MTENNPQDKNKGAKKVDLSLETLVKKASLVGVLVLALAVVCIFALFKGFAAGKAPTSKHNAKLPTDKAESISVYANASGSGKTAKAELYLKNNQEESVLADKTTLSEVENVKQKDNLPYKEDEYFYWETGERDVKYEGSIAVNEVPLKMSVKYYLNGQQISGDDLYGKTGDFKMIITYHNNFKAKVGNTEYTVPMTAINYFYVGDSMTEIKVTTGKVLKAGKKNVVIGLATPGLSDVLSAKLFGVASNKIVVTGKIKRFAGFTMSTNCSSNLLTYVDSSILQKFDVDSLVIKVDALSKKALTLADQVTALAVKYSAYIPMVRNITGQVNGVIVSVRDLVIKVLNDMSKYNKELTADLDVLDVAVKKVAEEVLPLSTKERLIIQYEALKRVTDETWTHDKELELESKIAAMSDVEWAVFRPIFVKEIIDMWSMLLPAKNSEEDPDLIADKTEQMCELAEIEIAALPTDDSVTVDSFVVEDKNNAEEATDTSGTEEAKVEAAREKANSPFDHTEDQDLEYIEQVETEISARSSEKQADELDTTKNYLNSELAPLLEIPEASRTPEQKQKIKSLQDMISSIKETQELASETAEAIAGEGGLLEKTNEINSMVDALWQIITTGKIVEDYFLAQEEAIKKAHPLDYESTEEWKKLKEREKRYKNEDGTYMNPVEIVRSGISVTKVVAKLIDDNLDQSKKDQIVYYANEAVKVANKVDKIVNKVADAATKAVGLVQKANKELKSAYNKYIRKLLGIYNTNLKGLAGDLTIAQQAQINAKPITGLTEGWTGETTYYYEVPVGGGGSAILQLLTP